SEIRLYEPTHPAQRRLRLIVADRFGSPTEIRRRTGIGHLRPSALCVKWPLERRFDIDQRH
ncbi:hypothetical protein P0D88_47090, partial [Paraburkholderia sp. RL18-103-BIB-C]|uniref:hypothetical protein n=1 Tax=Paraburkholderia sp. RL18-103-BIB-C TaxID=3031637 RepID=UPI0038B71FC4